MHLTEAAAENIMPCRPMAMMIPDYALVAEVMLFSEGNLYSLCLHRKLSAIYITRCSRWQQVEALACCRDCQPSLLLVVSPSTVRACRV